MKAVSKAVEKVGMRDWLMDSKWDFGEVEKLVLMREVSEVASMAVW